jgi:hypothetical protein
MDVLSRAQKVCIDYEKKRIFFRLDEARANSVSTTRVFVVPVSIQGMTMRLLVDTGF